jgi:hypothetical protein
MQTVGVGLLQTSEHTDSDVFPPALPLETVVNRLRQNDKHQDYNGDKDGTHGNLQNRLDLPAKGTSTTTAPRRGGTETKYRTWNPLLVEHQGTWPGIAACSSSDISFVYYRVVL